MGVRHPDPELHRYPLFLSGTLPRLAKLLQPSPHLFRPLLLKLQLVKQIRHPNVASLLEVRRVETDNESRIYTEQQHPLANLRLSMSRQTYLRSLQGLLRALRQYRLYKLRHGSITLASLRGQLDLKLLPPTQEVDLISDDFLGVTIAMVQIADYDTLSSYYQGSANWQRIEEGLKKVQERFGSDVKELIRYLTLKQDFQWLQSQITKLIYQQPTECIRLNHRRAKSEQVPRNCIQLTCGFEQMKSPFTASISSHTIDKFHPSAMQSTSLAKTQQHLECASDSNVIVTPFGCPERMQPNLMHRTRQTRHKDKQNAGDNFKAPPLKPLKIMNHFCRQTCPITLKDQTPLIRYQGTLLNNKYHGPGKIIYPCPLPGLLLPQDLTSFQKHALFFQGNFKQGLKEGPGTFRTQSGQVFTGNFFKDLPDGKGVLKGEGITLGEWKEGKLIKQETCKR